MLSTIKQNIFIAKIIFVFLFICNFSESTAQPPGCIFKEPLLNIDFGSDNNRSNIDLSGLRKYQQAYDVCPIDGAFSFASHTYNCFNGDWFNMNTDHTAKGDGGNMMLVNANVTGGTFFYYKVNGISGNTTYEFAAWMMNVCRIGGGCSPLPPNIHILLITNTGQKVGDFRTGLLTQGYTPHWRRYTGFFTTPANATSLTLIMEDNTIGGCGNDFALDDITLRECIKPTPVKSQPKPVKPVVKQPSVTARKPITTTPAKTTRIKNNLPDTLNREPAITVTTIKERSSQIPLPKPILTRENPIVKQIQMASGEITIDLYDNGIIDGDTVSIYHNNELIFSRAGLSDKPVEIKVKVDAQHPHHEIVMVAENLGTIPPNTSLMIVTEGTKRSEVFISSSEQKNAKVVIDLK
jgi:hypothetical protein